MAQTSRETMDWMPPDPPDMRRHMFCPSTPHLGARRKPVAAPARRAVAGAKEGDRRAACAAVARRRSAPVALIRIMLPDG